MTSFKYQVGSQCWGIKKIQHLDGLTAQDAEQKLANGIKEKYCKNPFFIPSHCPENIGEDGVDVDGIDNGEKKRKEKRTSSKKRKAKQDKLHKNKTKINFSQSSILAKSNKLYLNFGTNRKIKNEAYKLPINPKTGHDYVPVVGGNEAVINEFPWMMRIYGGCTGEVIFHWANFFV